MLRFFSRLLTANNPESGTISYAYDAWGNLYQKNPGSPAGENMVKTADTNNRLSDSAGNVTNDGTGGTYVYDAENRIVSATNGSVTTTYVYDAFGRRIKKSSGSTATNYWFGPAGETAAETDASGNWTNYIFFGGQRLARNVSGDIKYYITDHLHSTAVFADKSGTVLDDNDFYPWGGVVPGIGTTTSNNHYKFTGKERDTESGLDYFGARYYANVTGRFMSPDWAAKPTSVPYAEFGDPQSLNLYSYVRNSPVVRVDADGHQINDFNNMGFQNGLDEWGDGNWNGRMGEGYQPEGGGPQQAATQPPQPPAQQPTPSGSFQPDGSFLKASLSSEPKCECFAQLKTRDVNDDTARKFGGSHSYWYVQGSAGTPQMISGFPSKDGGKTVSNDGTGSLAVRVHGLNDTLDTVTSTTTWSSGLSHANCAGVDRMLSAAGSWNQSAYKYNAPLGPNSNTAAQMFGLIGDFHPPRPSGAFGWMPTIKDLAPW